MKIFTIDSDDGYDVIIADSKQEAYNIWIRDLYGNDKDAAPEVIIEGIIENDERSYFNGIVKALLGESGD